MKEALSFFLVNVGKFLKIGSPEPKKNHPLPMEKRIKREIPQHQHPHPKPELTRAEIWASVS